MMKKAHVRLFCLIALVIALVLSAGPARADSQPAAVARELEKARAFQARQDDRNACRAFSRADELAEGKSSPSLIGVANCYRQIKDGDKAVATARRALAVAASSEEKTRATTTLGSILLSQPDEKSWTEAVDLFREQVASSNGAAGVSWLISALLASHRDPEAVEFLQSLRKQGKSTEEIQQMLCTVNVGNGADDAGRDPQRIDERNARVRKLDPEAPMRIGGKVSRPEIRHQVKPEMPPEARQHHGDLGTVIVEAVVDAQGQVRSTRVLRERPYGLTESAVNSIRAWTFKPSTLDGAPVPVCYVLTVNFAIR